METGPVEGRAAQLAGRLEELLGEYRPSISERFQDWLMDQMARDPDLKSRLLQFVDVLAAPEVGRDSRRVNSLFREYCSGRFANASLLLRIGLSAGCRRTTPAWFVSGASRRLMRSLAGRFIAPPGSELPILRYLESHGRSASLDLVGEEVLSEYEADEVRDRYLQLIGRLAGYRTSGLQLSLRLTSLTGDFNPQDPDGTLRRVRGRLEDIVRGCISGGIGLTIDAERFQYRESIWRVFCDMFGPGSPFAGWPGAGIAVQSYLKDSEDNLRAVLEFARTRQIPFQVRLVKGAYWDYEVMIARENRWPVPVFEHKSDTDRAFRNMLESLLRSSRYVTVAVGSHNVDDHACAEALGESLGLGTRAIEHQTLFRTAEGLSRALGRMGWAARDYVPSGELVPGMAYLVRRVLENTSLEGFLLRSRSGGSLRPANIDLGSPGAELEVADSSFHNYPPKRLFLTAENASFESVLKSVSGQWGQEYPVKLGINEVRTGDVKSSLSPSGPDPQNPVGRVHMARVTEAQQAIAVARSGVSRWRTTPASERARVLRGAAARLAEERDRLAAWIVHEGGRTRAEALADVDEAVDHFAYSGDRLLACESQIEQHFRPRGVVAVISPWNFPAALPAGMVSGALAAGNCVILKSAEQTLIVAHHLVETLHAGGVPEDVLLHLPGLGETVGDYLVASPDVDMVAFTGSKAVGLDINRKASSVRVKAGPKKVVAEMGGKNAIIVFADADLDEAVRAIVLSAFEHANQKCSACSRVFIHRSIYARLRERLEHAVDSIQVGPAGDPGTLVNPLIEYGARERLLAYAAKARSEGRVLVDRIDTGSRNPLQVGPMLVELDPAALSRSVIAREEIFGPILAIVLFDDEEKMVAQVNDTAYALTAGVFSRSPATVARMVRQVRAGNIYVNRKITGARVGIEPFGGFQLSGTGPKVGGSDYLFAYLTRRGGYEAGSSLGLSEGGQPLPDMAGAVDLWLVAAGRRREVLQRCIWLLGRFRDDVLRALKDSPGSYGNETPEQMARQMKKVAVAVVDTAVEVMEAEASIQVPGQRNFVDWQTPRGRGFVATGPATGADLFAGMVFGPLLAGNGVVLAPSAALRPLAGVLIHAMHRAGVPARVVKLAPQGCPQTAVSLAGQMFHFAVTDMGPEDTFLVWRSLGETREDEGQTWVKALISMQDGRRPGEPGFVRQFALPKTVAIRTLRHGAILDLPGVGPIPGTWVE